MGVTNRKQTLKQAHQRPQTIDVDESPDSLESPESPADQLKERLLDDKEQIKERLQQDKTQLKKRLHELRRVVFVLGAVLGLLLTVFFSTVSHPSLKLELDRLVTFESVQDLFDDWRDILPLGLTNIILDYDFLSSNQSSHGLAELFSVGRRMVAERNLSTEYNVVMVPGVILTGLELWGTLTDGDCPLIAHFRKRLWGSFYMLRTMVLDKACWLKHVMLDTETGLDPPNIRVRAAQGFEAADFFVAGYWIWNKILQNLSVLGYGPNNMVLAAYDWRLAYLDLELRDGYFSKLKLSIELALQHLGKKLVLVGHLMGSQVIYYFLKWVEASGEHYGNGGSSWCNDHIALIVDISGSSLGTPKSITAMLSGEMKDTVQLNAVAVYGLEKFFSRKERVVMLRSFGGIALMFPKGGETIWGDLTQAPDDPQLGEDELNDIDDEHNEPNHGTFGKFLRYNYGADLANYTVDETIDKLLSQSPRWYSNRVREQYSFGLAKTEHELDHNDQHHKYWLNPLELRLPYAPDMKIYCFYGVGKATERAYTYTKAANYTGLDMIIDADLSELILFGDGDGTVSLMTHAMCHEWQKGKLSRYNPAGIEVTIVEIKDEPDRFDIRGGAKTADHVDILGLAELNELVLRVAAGDGPSIENRYVSSLKDIMARIEL